MRSTTCYWLLGGAIVAGLIAGIQMDIMTGFLTWLGISLTIVLIWAGLNHGLISEALEINPIRLTSWVAFIGLFIAFHLVFTTMLSFPQAGSALLAVTSAGFCWWTYYTLEPVKA